MATHPLASRIGGRHHPKLFNLSTLRPAQALNNVRTPPPHTHTRSLACILLKSHSTACKIPGSADSALHSRLCMVAEHRAAPPTPTQRHVKESHGCFVFQLKLRFMDESRPNKRCVATQKGDGPGIGPLPPPLWTAAAGSDGAVAAVQKDWTCWRVLPAMESPSWADQPKSNLREAWQYMRSACACPRGCVGEANLCWTAAHERSDSGG